MEQNSNQDSQRIRLLLVSTEMHIGGVTTALLSLLNTLDYGRFSVDLLLYDHGGPLQGEIPPQVRLLPPAKQPVGLRRWIRQLRVFSPSYLAGRMNALLLKYLRNQGTQGLQVRSRLGSRYSRRFDREYDLAISFIEFWPFYYTAHYVKARRKLAWIHTDYANSELDVRLDYREYGCYDRIVFVSESCRENFCTLVPEFAKSAVYLPNLVSERYIQNRSLQKPAKVLRAEGIRLITCSRINFQQKALDRGVRVFDRLCREGHLKNVTWYILGSGPDSEALRKMIHQMGRENQIELMEAEENPLPLVRQCDGFLLLSRFEGKPLAVTEALILGLPALVTRYSSAAEQIENGVNSLIVDNTEEGIAEGLIRFCEEPGLLEKLARRVRMEHFGNETDIERYYALWKEIGVPIPPEK